MLFVNNEYQQKPFETVELVREVVGYLPDPDQLPVFLHLSDVTD